MGLIAQEAKLVELPVLYDILRQYVEQGDGTLRLGRNGIQFAPKSVKNAAVKSQFSGGGTQGRTQMGGV